jgi:hypothetical protein
VRRRAGRAVPAVAVRAANWLCFYRDITHVFYS